MTTGSEKFDNMGIKTGGLALLLISLTALILRFVHLWLVKNTDLVQVPIIDAAFYHQWAVEISRGNVIGDHTFFMSPLYSYFTGLIYAITGASPIRLMIFQSVMGVGTILLLYRWGASLAGRKVGLLTAGIAALYAPFIFYESTLLTSTLILFLSAIVLNLAEAVFKRDNIISILLLGGIAGLSALARPLVLLFIPFLYLLFILDDRTTWLKRSLLLTAGVLVFLIPVGIRNLIIGGEFSLTTSSAGMNFYVGNNPDATGLYWEAPFLSSIEPQYEDEDYRLAASEAMEKNLSTGEAGSYWFNQSLDWIIHKPFSYLKLLARKTFYFWNRAEFANNISIYYGREVSPILKFNPFGFYLICPLGLAGLILLIRRLGWKRNRVAITWVAAYFVGGLIFFVSSEYRLPIVLVLMVGASYLIVEIIGEFKARRIETAVKLLILGLLFMPLSNFRTDFIHSGENARMDVFNIGNTFLKYGKNNEAITRFKHVLEIDPYFPEGIMKLADAYYRAGMTEEAIETGKKAGLKDPESILEIIKSQALYEAYALLSEGKAKMAMEEFAVAGLDPGDAVAETTRVNLIRNAQMAVQAGNPTQALEFLTRVNSTDKVPDPMVLHNIAAIQYRIGALDSAEFYAAKVLVIDSLNAPSTYLMARILNASGRWEEAQRLIMRVTPHSAGLEDQLNATRAKMDSLTELGLWKEALMAYGEYGKLGFDIHPDDRLRIGRLQLEIGNFDQALQLFSSAEAAGINVAGLYFHKGRALVGLSLPDDAIAAIQRCLAAEPDHIAARILLARLYISKGKIKDAWSELEAVSHLEIVNKELAEEYNSLIDSLKAL